MSALCAWATAVSVASTRSSGQPLRVRSALVRVTTSAAYPSPAGGCGAAVVVVVAGGGVAVVVLGGGVVVGDAVLVVVVLGGGGVLGGGVLGGCPVGDVVGSAGPGSALRI